MIERSPLAFSIVFDAPRIGALFVVLPPLEFFIILSAPGFVVFVVCFFRRGHDAVDQLVAIANHSALSIECVVELALLRMSMSDGPDLFVGAPGVACFFVRSCNP